LTKDNLAKSNCQGSKNCCFCGKDETIFSTCYLNVILRVQYGLVLQAAIHATVVSDMFFDTWPCGISKDLKRLVPLSTADHHDMFSG
jgi:hypothetical protein